MDKYVECLCCDEVEAVDYFELLGTSMVAWTQWIREFKAACEIVYF